MSEGGNLNWKRALTGWLAYSSAFDGFYDIQVDDDGFFEANRYNRQSAANYMKDPCFTYRADIFQKAKDYCRRQEKLLLAEKQKGSVKTPGCCPFDDETVKKHASTFGPVPASQEQEKNALNEDRIRSLEKAVTKLNAEVAVMSVRLDAVTKRNETAPGPVCTFKGRNPLYQGGADEKDNDPESAILVEVRRLLLEQYNQGASLYAKVSRILEELKASKKADKSLGFCIKDKVYCHPVVVIEYHGEKRAGVFPDAQEIRVPIPFKGFGYYAVRAVTVEATPIPEPKLDS